MSAPPKRERLIAPVLVLGIGFIAALPLWHAGFLNTRIVGETPYLLMRVQQLDTVLRAGVFPARWMPDGAYGYGYPWFSFYAALPYYAAAALHLVGLSYVTAIKLTQTLGFLTGALGVYLWTNRHFRHQAASMTAAALFTFAPMHMINVYVRGDSLSEFWAMAMYPLLLWAVDLIIDRPSARRIALFGLFFGGLIVSHNISAVIFSPLLGLYILWQMRSRLRQWRRWASLGAGLVLGFGLTIWFWLPALAERSTLDMGNFLTGFLDWRNNFLDQGLFQAGWLFDYHTNPFRVGLWQTVWMVTGTAALLFLLVWQFFRARRSPSSLESNSHGWRSATGIGIWAAVATLIAIFMTQSVSAWFYEHVPFFPYIQYSWRWLAIVPLPGAALAAFIVEIWLQQSLRLIVSSALIILTAITALASLNLNFIPLTDAEITPARLNEAEYYSGDVGTTIRSEYLPVNVHPRPFTGPAILNERPLKVTDGAATGRLTASGAAWQTWQLHVTTDQAEVAIPTFYWPGWVATLEDGSSLPTSAIDGIGWLAITAPKGDHLVTFRLRETPIRFMADALGGMAALIWLALVLNRPPLTVRQRLEGWSSGQVKRVRLLALTLLLIVSSGIILFLIDHFTAQDPGLSVHPEAAQFLTASYRHVYPTLTFTSGEQLTGFTYSDQTVTAGNPWTVTLVWDRPTAAHLELIPPLVNIWGYDAALVAASIPAGTNAVTLNIPPAAAPGLYFVRLTVGDESYDLTPIRITQGIQPAQSVTPAPGLEDARFGDVLRLLDVTTDAIDRGRLNVYMRWNVLRPITRTYSLSIRFRSPVGIELAKSDAQLGVYGTFPAAYWPPVFSDWLSLPGLDGLPPGEGYQLSVALFDGDQLVGKTEIRNIAVRNSPAQDNPAPTSAFEGDATPQLAEVEQGADLPILCQWRGPVAAGWQVRWQLLSENNVAWTATTPLAPGARLDWWPSGEQFSGVTPLAIPVDLAPGDYTLHWSVIDASDQVILPSQVAGTVRIKPTSRLFSPPPNATALPTSVIFGDMIQLWGVGADQTRDKLALHIVWRAAVKPDRDYTYFVHIQRIDAPTPAAQVDTMPRQNSYPTSGWLPDEYVADDATLNLGDLAPGTYNVWLGWYDSNTGTRLELNTGGPDRRYLVTQLTIS